MMLSHYIQADAQSGKVLLNNGSVLYGEVAELNADKLSMKVGDDKIVLPVESVKLLKIKRLSDSIQNINMNVYRQLSKNNFRGFEKNIQLGILRGRENSEVSAESSFSASLQLNYRHHQYLQGGIAVGYDHYDEFGTFPVQLVYRGDLSSKWSTLFYYASGGYGFAKLLQTDDVNPGVDRAEGGMTYRAGMGYRWRLEKTGFEFAVGWKYQKVDLVYAFYDSFRVLNENFMTLKRSINRIEIKFGIIF